MAEIKCSECDGTIFGINGWMREEGKPLCNGCYIVLLHEDISKGKEHADALADALEKYTAFVARNIPVMIKGKFSMTLFNELLDITTAAQATLNRYREE